MKMTEHDEAVALPPAAYAAALACLPGMGPAWLVATLRRHKPWQAWELVKAGELRPWPGRSGSSPQADGRPQQGSERWSEWACRYDVRGQWRRCCQNNVQVTWPGAPGYPEHLYRGPTPAGVLFCTGDLSVLDRSPSVALVGTRRCSHEGAAVAFKLGYDLARAGVTVVSGLALGIDGAAHSGAVSAMKAARAEGSAAAPTIGVAASGVDVIYPRQHEALWREIQRLGAVISETPPGVPAQSWRFPSRNRVIAGMAQMVVVVECHVTGGSWHTVSAAERCGTDVGAVPGSVLNGAAVGTNNLIHDGALTVRHAQDVLDALACLPRGQLSLDAPPINTEEPAPHLGPVEDRVLGHLSTRSVCLDDMVERCGLPVVAVVVALERLSGAGLAVEDNGWWSRKL
jgi:DNA processing protein